MKNAKEKMIQRSIHHGLLSDEWYTATTYIPMDFLRWLREKDLKRFACTADGRDTPPASGKESRSAEAKMKEIGVAIGVIPTRLCNGS